MTTALRTGRKSATHIDPFDLASALLMAFLLLLILATFKEYAVSNDEGLQHHYGELIIAYYESGFSDRSVFGFDNLYLYGGLFDIIAVLLAHLLPFDLYDIRHVLSALTGLGGLAATWATARMIAGPRAGLLAALALATCGVWYGGMFNHTKDIPFASAMMGAAFFLLRAARDFPAPRRRDVLWFGLLLGCALGLRATGLLMVGYVAVVIGLWAWASRKHQWRGSLLASGRCLAQFLPAFVLAYVIMIASWPWSSLNFFNPVRAIFAFAHFHYPIRTIIGGRVYLMNEVPRWYEPEYLLIKLPLAVLIGAGTAIVSAGWSAARALPEWSHILRKTGVHFSEKCSRTGTPSDHGWLRNIAILSFMIVFPLTCQVVGHGPSFTGMRHFLFVVPPIAALAGIGIDLGLSFLQARGLAPGLAAGATVAAALAWNCLTLTQLHPYEYLFYNSLVGGLPGAAGSYATDYWVNIMPEAVGDLEHYVDTTKPAAAGAKPLRYSVAVCGERVSFENEAEPALQWTGDWSHADFFIAPTHMNCDRVLRGRTVSIIARLGVAIGVVKDLRGVSPQARWTTPTEVAHASAVATNARTAPAAASPQ
jgi:hypothetical protein